MTDRTTRTFIVGSRGPFKFENAEGENVVREPGDLIPEAEGFSHMVVKLALETLFCFLIRRKYAPNLSLS